MAEITRQRQGEMVRAVLEVLSEHPEGVHAQEVISRVEQMVGSSEFERGYYASGVRRFEKILRFNTINAVKAGWMVKNKGIWTVTDEGRAALSRFTDPAELMRESSRLYREWEQARPAPIAEEEVALDEAAEESAAATLEEAEENAWREIADYLRHMNPYEFQDLVAALLRGMGYHVAWVSPPGPDRGLDIVAYTDPLGASGPRIKVQVKRRAETKSTVDDIRSFMALLGTQDIGIFVSSGGFTSDAEREARGQENRRLTLVNLEQLFDLWVQYYEAIDETERRLLPLKPVYFLASDA
ncbi:MAG TPA: restriction endonuclease [Acidimicrobiales bacterium]|nr:restriction endonuclease [Acidimicrobiales bacterium]